MNSESFEQCLKRIIKTHGITNAELSRLLNYKSKNTIQRIISGESGKASKTKVFNDIINNRNLFFNNDEIKELELALDISSIGEEKHLALNEMNELMFQEFKKYDSPQLTDIQSMNIISMKDLLESIKNNTNDIIIINCCWKAVILALDDFLSKSQTTQIKQCILLNKNLADTIRNIGNILPIFHNTNYAAYSIESKDIHPNSVGELSHNVILIRSKEENGKISTFLIVNHNEHNGFVIKEKYNLFDYWQNLANKYESYANPIKTTYEQKNSANAYIKFTELYYKLENNNTIFTFRPDFCMTYVNPTITKNAFIDGIKQLQLKGFMSEKNIAKLEEIHTKRFNNVFSKSKVTQHVCTEASLEKFAQTGLLSDHLFAMRPYTKAERIEILKTLLENIEHNPHFNFWLLKDNNSPMNIEVICYDKFGVEFTSMQTDYNFTGNHSEAIIKHKDFVNLYKEYFVNEILRKRVHDQTETVRVFIRIIAELESSAQ